VKLNLYEFNQKVLEALPYLEAMEQEQIEQDKERKDDDIILWVQEGVVRSILDLTVNEYYQQRTMSIPEDIQIIRNKYRKLIANKS